MPSYAIEKGQVEAVELKMQVSNGIADRLRR